MTVFTDCSIAGFEAGPYLKNKALFLHICHSPDFHQNPGNYKHVYFNAVSVIVTWHPGSQSITSCVTPVHLRKDFIHVQFKRMSLYLYSKVNKMSSCDEWGILRNWNCRALTTTLSCAIWIDHFTVVGLVTWPLNASEVGVDLVLIETSLVMLCKSSCSYAN